MVETTKGVAHREYKDRLFRFIFGSGENLKYLLSLCNAIEGTNYTDPNDMEITTLSDVLYIKMKNDISFLLGSQMNLYEHQSSYNPNMPLRGLEYFAELLQKYMQENKLNIYSKSLKKIPTPRYIVFYNGTEEQPDIVKLRLSDAFQIPDYSGEYKWTATMININYGHNKDLMKKCKPLEEYAEFVQIVREYAQRMTLTEAIDYALDKAEKWECIGDFLIRCKNEVYAMLLTEFDQKAYDADLYEDGKEKGKEEGYNNATREHIINMQKEGLSAEVIARCVKKPVEVVKTIMYDVPIVTK